MVIPKIIENLRERIIMVGRDLILKNGYQALSIRDVASNCGIAAGTVYNYFPSKEVLSATIMLVDWEQELQAAQLASGDASDCMDGLQAVYDAIARFTEKYVSVWGGADPVSGMRIRFHPQLVGQLRDIIFPLLKRFCPDVTPEPSTFIAEILLGAATRPDVCFAAIQPYLSKLI